MLSDGKRVTIQGGPFVVHAQVWRELNFDTRVGVSRVYVMLEPDEEHPDYNDMDDDENKLKLTPREARRLGRMLLAAAGDAVKEQAATRKAQKKLAAMKSSGPGAVT